MAFIDPDYVDMSRIGEEAIEDVSDSSLVSEVISGGSRRGKDVQLFEIAEFKDNDEFKESEIKGELDDLWHEGKYGRQNMLTMRVIIVDIIIREVLNNVLDN